jgi:hypothetical protein
MIETSPATYMEAPTATFTLDSFEPHRLRCDRCGHGLAVPLDPWDDPESLRMLTEEEAAAYWPDLAIDLHSHAMTCPGAWFGWAQEQWEEMAAEEG